VGGQPVSWYAKETGGTPYHHARETLFAPPGQPNEAPLRVHLWVYALGAADMADLLDLLAVMDFGQVR
jgi:hypothetical protein